MSIEIMNRVWKQSPQGGSQLLLLLAIADNANDNGFAWPGQEYLAKKIRMNKRSISRLTLKLNKAGELFINNRGKDGKVTQYIVTIGMTIDEFEVALKFLKLSTADKAKAEKWYAKALKKGVTICHPRQIVGGDTAMSGGGDTAMSGGGDIAVSPEPSLTVNEPSFSQNPQKTKTKLPPAPIIKANSYIEKYTDTERQALNTLGKILARHPNITAKTTDDLKSITLIGYEIAKITKTDINTIDATELKALAGLTIRLSAKPNIEAKLPAFQKWWYAEDWRGKQRQPPTVKTLGSTWGQFEAAKVAPPNAASNGPVLTEAKKQRLAELVAAGGE